MTPPLSVWRKLDRYLLRNHPEAWSLSLHELHALVIVATAVLTLMVWLLPLEILLEHFAWVRTLFMIFAVPLLSISVVSSGARQGPPLTRRRWPRALSRWYFLIVLFSPVLFVSLIAQARFQPLTRGYDLNALPNIQKSCKQVTLATKQECVGAMSKLTGRPHGQISQDTIDDALDLSNVVPDGLILRWGDFLLLLLCVAYARQGMELISVDMPPLKVTASLMFFLQLLYPSALGLFYVSLLDYPPRHISWHVVTGMVMLPPLSLFHVIISSDQRRGVALTWCWIALLMGLPLLVPLIPLLLSSPEQRLLHQAILLGGFLLLTPWLQRLHDRVRALPL